MVNLLDASLSNYQGKVPSMENIIVINPRHTEIGNLKLVGIEANLYIDILPASETQDSLKNLEVLGSTSPLKLNPSRYLVQRWFSPQAFKPLQTWFRDALPYLRIRKFLFSLYLLLRSFTYSSFPE